MVIGALLLCEAAVWTSKRIQIGARLVEPLVKLGLDLWLDNHGIVHLLRELSLLRSRSNARHGLVAADAQIIDQ